LKVASKRTCLRTNERASRSSCARVAWPTHYCREHFRDQEGQTFCCTDNISSVSWPKLVLKCSLCSVVFHLAVCYQPTLATDMGWVMQAYHHQKGSITCPGYYVPADDLTDPAPPPCPFRCYHRLQVPFHCWIGYLPCRRSPRDSKFPYLDPRIVETSTELPLVSKDFS
jgi:hypothetical protein